MAFYEIMMTTLLSLIPIVNPIGMAAVFLSMTEHLSPEERHRTAYRVAINSFVLLICVLLFGRMILEFFGLSLPFIRIAGGLLVAFTAWSMLNSKPKLSKKEREEHTTDKSGKEIAFFPLTLPITAGAGAIAIMVTVALSIPERLSMHSISMYIGATVGNLIMCIIIAVCYRFSDNILNRLGNTGTNVITRLSAFVLLAIGISVIWSGIVPLLVALRMAK